MTTAPAAGTPLRAAMIGLFESMHDGLRFCLDDRLRVTSAGGRGLAVFDCTPTQMIGKDILSLLPPAAAEGIAPRLLAALVGEASSFELLFPGGCRLQLAATPFGSGGDEEGGTRGVDLFGVWPPAPVEKAHAQIETAVQENERRQRELMNELAAERDKLAAVLEAMPVGVWIAGPDGQLISKNSESDRIWRGTPPATKNIADFTRYVAWDPQTGRELQPEDYPMAQIILTGETPAPIELRIRRLDGTEGAVLVSAAPIRDALGVLTGLVGINLDITQRVQAEEALRASEVRYRTLFEENQTIMVAIDTESGEVVDANPAAAAYYGITRDELRTKKLTDIVSMTISDIQAEFERAQVEQRNCVLLRHRRADGTEREMEVYISYANLNGRSLAYGIVYDVTQRRQLQEQVLRQERLAAVGQLAAGIAHDFNNIMSVISVYAEMTSEAPGLREHERARMNTIMGQARQATQLIRQILDFSRQSVLERQVLDLLPLLKEEVKLLRQTLPESIEIRLDGVAGEYLVKADPTRVQQLVMNLAVNARDAMPHGGQLRLGLAHMVLAAPDEAPIAGMEPGPWIRLEVSDTGTGIPPAQMTHIFEPFFTTKAPGKGTGLGLAQAHGIVAQHGGFITLASEVGSGTTFTIYLPALPTVRAGFAEGSAASRGLPARGHGELVLVVEDDAAVRKAIGDLLLIWGYRVIEAANGEEALTQLAQGGETPDVILSDVVMPRLGGVGLVKGLRHVGAGTPVILMSGHPMGEDPAELDELHIAAWVEKPPRPELLAQALTEALISARGE